MLLAINSAQCASRRGREKSLAVFTIHTTLSTPVRDIRAVPQRRLRPGSKYISAAHRTSYTMSAGSCMSKEKIKFFQFLANNEWDKFKLVVN